MAPGATMTARNQLSLPAVEEQKRVAEHFQSNADYWKRIYEGCDLEATIYQQRRDVVLALADKLALPAGSQVLEVGCGAGMTSVALALRGFQVEAIDSSPAMIELTRQAALKGNVSQRIEARVCDVNSLPFAQEHFDLVLAIGLIPWVQSPQQVLGELARVVKPGGYLIVSSENRWQLHHVLDPLLNPFVASFRPKMGDWLRHFGWRKPLTAPRHHACSNRKFDSKLASLQMEKLESRTVGFGPFSLAFRPVLPDSAGVKVHRFLQNLADRGFPVLRSAGCNYIVLAQKPRVQGKIAA